MLQTHKKRISVWVVIIIIIGLIAGCSASDSNKSSSISYSLSESDSKAKNDSLFRDTSTVDAEKGEAAETEAGGGGGFLDSNLTNIGGFIQKIIYTADLNMQVGDLAKAAAELEKAIEKSGGYILQFEDTKQNGEIGSSYTIKVPAAGFKSFIDRVEQIEHRYFERSIGGKDVSEEYVDLESRLKARQLVEERLLVMMEKAVKADDLLKFSDQLSSVQEDIERIKGKIRFLDKNVSFSTVELRMTQTDQAIKLANADKEALGGQMSRALTGSAKVVVDGLKLLLVILAGALPVVVLLAIIIAPVLWLLRRKKQNKLQESVHAGDEQQPPSSS